MNFFKPQASIKPPTVQIFASGTAQTYTTPAGCVLLKVHAQGPGGGGSGGCTVVASDAGNGAAGSVATTFGTSLITANQGSGGVLTDRGIGAGVGTINSPAITIINVPGGQGSGGVQMVATGVAAGGPGGNSFFGGGGAGRLGSGGGTAGATNSGSGGGGGRGVGAAYGGSGGGAGNYVEAFIPNPSPTYTYTVGAGGAGGTAGTGGDAGGAGAAGWIIVEEFYG